MVLMVRGHGIYGEMGVKVESKIYYYLFTLY